MCGPSFNIRLNPLDDTGVSDTDGVTNDSDGLEVTATVTRSGSGTDLTGDIVMFVDANSDGTPQEEEILVRQAVTNPESQEVTASNIVWDEGVHTVSVQAGHMIAVPAPGSSSTVGNHNFIIDRTGPSLVDATAHGDRLVLRFSDLSGLDDASLPDASAFAVRVNGSVVPVESLSVDGAAGTVTLLLGSEVSFGQTVAVSYTDAAGDGTSTLQDLAGNDAASFSGAGAVVARLGETQVNTTTAGSQSEPSIAMNADGDFVVAWTSYGRDGTGVYARRYDRTGLAVGSEFEVIDGLQYDSSVAMDEDGDFVVTWTSYAGDGDGTGVYAQRYASNGDAAGSAFRVNSTIDHSQHDSSVAMDGDGDFVVTWTSDGQDGEYAGVYAQRYASNGAAVGGEFRVNSTTVESQYQSSVAMDAEGGFVVTWTSGGNQDGDGDGIYAQRYGSDGAAVGGEFRVNSTTGEDQHASAVAMDAEGNFVVAWVSEDPDTYYGGTVFAQRYDENGAAVGDEIHVNTSLGDIQSLDVTMDADGDFAVTWSSSINGAYNIYAQRFDGNADALGEEFMVNATSGARAPVAAVDADGDLIVAWTAEDDEYDGIYMAGHAAPEPVTTPTSPPTTPSTPGTGTSTTNIGGVPVRTVTTQNGDGTTSHTITIPVVASGSAPTIPLVSSGGGVLTAQVPAGYGLSVRGTTAPQTAGNAANGLQQQLHTFAVGGNEVGSGFLQSLPTQGSLLVQTLTPTVTGSTPPVEPLVISGSATEGHLPTALIIDSRGLPSGTIISLQNVEFAAVIGAVRVTGGEGSQNVWGDGAAQYMVLGADNDTLHGGDGDDYVGSRTGSDVLFGDGGADTVAGGEDADIAYGNRQDDMVYGNRGTDTLFGGQGHDSLFGGQDGDVAYGNLGEDAIYGNRGADTLYGGRDDDLLFGGRNDDNLTGGIGADTLTGGLGADRFVFAAGHGADVITDFRLEEGDRLMIGDRSWTVRDGAAGAVLDFGSGDSVTLTGIAAGQVTTAWFVLS